MSGNIDLLSKNVKCRSPHECTWCGEGIKTGDKAHYRVGFFDRAYFREYMHPECWKALNRSDLSDDEGYTPKKQKRGWKYNPKLEESDERSSDKQKRKMP